MSSSSHAPSDPHGSLSSENAPRILVRAGKHFVCTACGTLVEIPADVVGKLVLAAGHSPQNQPGQAAPETAASAQPEPTQTVPEKETAVDDRNADVRESASVMTSPVVKPNQARPPRPKRPQEPKQAKFGGKIIDGLLVPTADQLDRALAWISFRLKVLDRQGSEIHRLKKLLKQRTTYQVPCLSPRGQAKEEIIPTPAGGAICTTQTHAQVRLGVRATLHFARYATNFICGSGESSSISIADSALTRSASGEGRRRGSLASI